MAAQAKGALSAGASLSSADRTRFIAYTALLVAAGVLLPMLFHQVGVAGPVFLPMHFPVILGGLLFGPLCGLAVGFFSPVLSTLTTGMPPAAAALVMVPEMMTYGVVCGWVRFGLAKPPWVALLVAMIAGRAVMGLAVWVLIPLVNLHAGPWAFVVGAVGTGLPGIAAQAVLIPVLIRRLERHVPGAASP